MYGQPEIRTTITVPTELGRGDPFLDMFWMGLAGLGTWYAFNMGHVLWAIPPLLLIAVCVLTGEPAADVPFIGAIAAGLRSKLGLRRAHEWIQAWAHYFRIRQWPDLQRWSHDKSQRVYMAVQTMRRSVMDWSVRRARPRIERLLLPCLDLYGRVVRPSRLPRV
jgi:hypothetical protein